MGNKKIGPIKRAINKKVRKEIRRTERRKGRELERNEKRAIKKAIINKMRTRATILGAVGLLGITGALGIGAKKEVKQLNQGIETQIENTKNAHDEFAKGLSVEIPEEDLEKTEALQEIENLKTPENVLNYVKQMYIEKYNENNNTEFGIENVKLYKFSENKVFYEDENGIQRYCTEKEYEEMGGKGVDGNLPVIEAVIAGGEKNILERVAQQQNGEITNIYNKNEIVEEDKEKTLTQLGEVVLTGINYYTSMQQEETSWGIKNEYKDRFANAIADYKREQKLEQENTNTVNEQIQQEDDERY